MRVWADSSADTKHLHNRVSSSVLYFAVLFFRFHPPSQISSESFAAACVKASESLACSCASL